MTFRRYLWSVLTIGVVMWPFCTALAFIMRQDGDVWTTWLLLGGISALCGAGLFVWIDRVEVFKDWPEG